MADTLSWLPPTLLAGTPPSYLTGAPRIVFHAPAAVLIKYIIFTLSADDNGEGGIFALYALICRAVNIRSNNRVHEADLSLLQVCLGAWLECGWVTARGSVAWNVGRAQ